LVRSYTVKDPLSLDVNFSAYRTMIPLKDGSLYSLVIESTDSRRPWVTTTKRSISTDQGATWSPLAACGSSTSASVNGASGDLLALGFGGSIQTASGKCGGAAQIGPGFEFVVAEKGGSATAPIWTITATLSKNTPGFDPSRGAPLWEICLGTINIDPAVGAYLGGAYSCGSLTDFSWSAKTGCAVWDPGTEMFWGDVPDAAPNVKKCDNQTTPVVLKKNKTGSGDLQATFCAPYPWDGGGGWR
jgi:hypothetical protein